MGKDLGWPRSRGAAGLNVTVPERTYEFLSYLLRRGTNLGKTETGIATFIVMRELNMMMEQDPHADYWRQGVGSKPES